MKERILLLLSEIEDLNRRQAGIYDKFNQSWERYQKNGDYGHLVETAFYLNQLYSGCEKIFSEIAGVFENTIDDVRWHKSLLERMRLAIEGVRPAFIGEDTFGCLNELRAFRHFFRHAYDTDLDPEKVALVVKKALRLKDKDLWARDTWAFNEFLRGLVGD